ncbi:class I SAM-dependent methyltransferase [Candidatus Microgenomates bacterium]|nr:class I SAM-dependent methyltransferase [Candidatus Microgenomates bacterium]
MKTATNKKDLEKQRGEGKVWRYVDKNKLKVIAKYAGKRILDVGCSHGTYVNTLNSRGYEAIGCDLLSYDDWKKHPRGTFKVSDIYDLSYKNRSVDTVLLFEVLEHLEHPSDALKEIGRVASKNVIISVPNCDLPSVFINSKLVYYHYYDRTHINFFTVSSLTELLIENGYNIDLIKRFDPIMPITLLLVSLYVPESIAVVIGKIFQRMPFGKKYMTDIVIVASQ